MGKLCCVWARSAIVTNERYQFKVVENSVTVEGGTLRGSVRSDESGAPPLGFEFSLLDAGSIRVRVMENDPPRWESPDILVAGADTIASDVEAIGCSQAGLKTAPDADKCFRRTLPSGSVVVAALKVRRVVCY